MNQTAIARYSLILAAGSILTACGTSEVTQTVPSSATQGVPAPFVVSSQYGLMLGGWNRAQKEATDKGVQFCVAKGLKFNFISEKRDGAPGWTPLSSTITFSCEPDAASLIQTANEQCKQEMLNPELDPIRNKVELIRASAEIGPPFEISSNDTFPTELERPVIAKWATMREVCAKRSDDAIKILPSYTPLQVTYIQQEKAFGEQTGARVGELIVALYQLKLTYGEFAQKRYEITHDIAGAENQFRQSALIADQQRQMQAQQLAQQQVQNSLATWSTYMQSVNARQPQTVHLDGSIQLRSNCMSQRYGNTVTTNCN